MALIAVQRSRTAGAVVTARKAQLKRVALRALAVLTMGGVLTALIALKTAIFVWHMHA